MGSLAEWRHSTLHECRESAQLSRGSFIGAARSNIDARTQPECLIAATRIIGDMNHCGPGSNRQSLGGGSRP
eukprot:555267-Rhodomonas_salina.2